MKVLQSTFAAIALLSLAGCGFTSEGDMVRRVLSESGAQAMDEGLRNAEWFQCKGASVGSVERRYGRSKELADAWHVMCRPSGEARIIRPAE